MDNKKYAALSVKVEEIGKMKVRRLSSEDRRAVGQWAAKTGRLRQYDLPGNLNDDE